LTGTKHHLEARSGAYAMGSDFCRIFAEDTQSLYLLSLLLTADPSKAEQCFISSLEESSAESRVFQEFARSWTRRVIIQNAIRLVAPRPTTANGISNAVSNSAETAADNRKAEVFKPELCAILKLHPFERFAFVLSVLEGHSDHESALLLGCTRQSLIEARVRALQEMGRSVTAKADGQTNNGPKTNTLEDNGSPNIHPDTPAPLAISA
jgi:DNA-directed RNA polymerase specialized sigma24 family protein